MTITVHNESGELLIGLVGILLRINMHSYLLIYHGDKRVSYFIYTDE